MEELLDLRKKADDFGVRKIADYMLDDPRFPLWSGSPHKYQHHHGTGGLLIHVSEVVDMCLLMARWHYPNIDAEILFLSALLHDWGKLWDYEPFDAHGVIHDISKITSETEWRGAYHKRNIHHISRSAMEWSKAVALNELSTKDSMNTAPPVSSMGYSTTGCKDIEDQVSHAILSHHGQREWGSPVAPNTPIAWLLHCCDMISSRMNDCEKFDYLKKSRE